MQWSILRALIDNDGSRQTVFIACRRLGERMSILCTLKQASGLEHVALASTSEKTSSTFYIDLVAGPRGW
jgi:hypothetical protein